MITVPLGHGVVCIGAVSIPNSGSMGIVFAPTDKPEAIGSVVGITSSPPAVFIECNTLESLAVLERKIAELKHMIQAREEDNK